MSATRILFAAGVVAVLVGAGYLLRRNEPAPSTDASVRLAQLEQEIARLKASTTIAALRLPVSQATGNGTAMLPAAEHSTAASTAGSTAPPAPAASTEEIRDTLQSRFVGEEIDRKWSVEAAALVRSHAGARLPEGSRLRSVECRASLCRIETIHRDLAGYRKFLQAPPASPELAWTGPWMTTVLRTEDDGTVLSVGYFGREGASLVPADSRLN